MPPRRRLFFAFALLSVLAGAMDAAVVRGTVTAANGTRLGDKVVAAYDAAGTLRGSAKTDAAGAYELKPLAAGRYRLLAFDESGAFATAFNGGAESFETTPFSELTEAAPLTVNFVLPAGGVVRGVVLAANAPVASAVIEAYNLSGTRRGSTDANDNGEYALVLPAGEYKLFAYDANGFWAGEFHLETRAFANAEPVRVTPPTVANVSFSLERAARVSGRISDADTGIRLDGMRVYAYTPAGALVAQTVSDASGVFRFLLGPGQYRFLTADPDMLFAQAFFASRRSFEESDVVTLAAGQDRTDINMAVPRGAVVGGRVNAPPGTIVLAYNLDGTLHASTPVGSDGEYRFVLAPGDYKLAVVDPLGVTATQFYRSVSTFAHANEIRVLGGDQLLLADFTPPPAGRFTGTVRDAATQTVLAGMIVAAYDTRGALTAQALTASNGTYQLAITPGTYRVLVFDPRFEYATSYWSSATSYETTSPVTVGGSDMISLDFGMRRGTRVTGTVTANGVPVEGAEVFALDGAGNRVAGGTMRGGAFNLVVVPGTYDFFALDPASHHYPSAPKRLTIGSSAPPLAFTLTPARKHRAARK